MKINKTNSAIKNILYGSINKIIAIFFPFIIRTMIIRYLGTEYVGLGSLFSAILNILNFAELGIGSAIVFSMYKPIANDDEATINALLNLYKKIYRIIGLCVLVIGLAIMPLLKYLIKNGTPPDINLYVLYSIYLANTVIGYFFFAYKNSLLNAHQKAGVLSNINSVVMLSAYICQIVVLCLFKNYYVYILFLPLSTMLINIYVAIITKKMYPQYICKGKIDKALGNQIKKQIAGLVSAKVCNIVQASIDSICISAFWGLALLGRYNNYFYIISSIQGFLIVFYNSIVAGVGNAVETESLEFNQSLFDKILFVYAWITGFCSVCFICLFQPFMAVWVGQENLLPMTMVICLVVQFYTGQINSVVILYKEAKGLWWEDKFRPLFVSVANLVVTIIASKFLFLEGVVIATIAAQLLVSMPLSTKVLYKHYFKSGHMKYYLKQLVYLCINVAVISASYFLCQLIPLNGVALVAALLAFCVIFPNVVYCLTFFKFKEFKATLNKIKDLWHSRKMRNKSNTEVKE